MIIYREDDEMNQDVSLPTKESVQILTQTILPLSLHGINPRTIMGDAEWEKIKHFVQKESYHECACCGRYIRHIPGDWIETHEMYSVDIEKHEFKLLGFVGLCNECHSYIHYGRLQMLLVTGQITIEEYNKIINHGNQLLQRFGLVKNDLPAHEIANPAWYLLYNGKKYRNN